jgi:hypothetical protein
VRRAGGRGGRIGDPRRDGSARADASVSAPRCVRF